MTKAQWRHQNGWIWISESKNKLRVYIGPNDLRQSNTEASEDSPAYQKVVRYWFSPGCPDLTNDEMYFPEVIRRIAMETTDLFSSIQSGAKYVNS